MGSTSFAPKVRAPPYANNECPHPGVIRFRDMCLPVAWNFPRYLIRLSAALVTAGDTPGEGIWLPCPRGCALPVRAAPHMSDPIQSCSVSTVSRSDVLGLPTDLSS